MSHIECVSSNITVVQRVTPALRVKHCLKQMQSRSRSDDGRKLLIHGPDNVFIHLIPIQNSVMLPRLTYFNIN